VEIKKITVMIRAKGTLSAGDANNSEIPRTVDLEFGAPPAWPAHELVLILQTHGPKKYWTIIDPTQKQKQNKLLIYGEHHFAIFQWCNPQSSYLQDCTAKCQGAQPG
jgi:hypothetical protein